MVLEGVSQTQTSKNPIENSIIEKIEVKVYTNRVNYHIESYIYLNYFYIG